MNSIPQGQPVSARPSTYVAPLTEKTPEKPPVFEVDSNGIPILAINYQLEGPVELGELTGALDAFYRQYVRNTRTTAKTIEGKTPGEDDTRLFVKKLETGSIFVDLMPHVLAVGGMANHLIPMMEYHNTFRDFVNYTKAYMDYFLKTRPEPPENTAPRSAAQDFKEFLLPAVRKKDGSLEMKLKHETASGEVTEVAYRWDSEQCLRAYTAASALADHREERADNYEQVLMWMPRLDATVHHSESTPDRGVIESISTKPLRVMWLSESDSMRVKNLSDNPLKKFFIVDVNVQRVRGLPKAYRVLKLHDIIDRDDPDDGAEEETLPGID